MSNQNFLSVNSLWLRLQAMEEEMRFDGLPYPRGMLRFPFRLIGQGFFPGGDGIWRDDSQLAESSSGLVASGGVMFLGNDFGTLKSYEKLRKKGYENPLTWKHVKERVKRAGLHPSLTFFTNAVMGLRENGTALDKKDWDEAPLFRSFCREFLAYQIEILKPRLIVVMGPTPRLTIDSLAVGTRVDSGRRTRMRVGDHMADFFCTTHPYGDFNFDQERKDRDGSELRAAWEQAQR